MINRDELRIEVCNNTQKDTFGSVISKTKLQAAPGSQAPAATRVRMSTHIYEQHVSITILEEEHVVKASDYKNMYKYIFDCVCHH